MCNNIITTYIYETDHIFIRIDNPCASSVMAQTSDAKNLKRILRQGKMEIVNGKYDEASEKFIEVWQHTDHTRESMEALYMLEHWRSLEIT